MAYSFISLDSIINDYLQESEQSISRYAKCYHIGFRGMEILGLDFFYGVRTQKLAVLSNKTVPLPIDCIKYTKIGVLNGKGEIVPLKYNPNLTTYADNWVNRQTVSEDNSIFTNLYNPSSPTFFNYWSDGSFTNIYGVPSSGVDVGSFKVDEQNGVILLSEDYSFSYLMVEYIASPQSDIQHYVPIQFREAIVSYLWWKDKKVTNVKKGAIGIQRGLEHEFWNERRLANARFRPIYIAENYQIQLEAQRITIKS